MSFFGKIGGFFEGLFHKVPPLAQRISATINISAPLAITILTLVDPADAPEAQPIVNEIQTDLATIKAVASQGQVVPGTPSGQAVESALNSINANAASLLQLAGVKNSAKKTEIEAAVNLLTSEMNAMLTEVSMNPTA